MSRDSDRPAVNEFAWVGENAQVNTFRIGKAGDKVIFGGLDPNTAVAWPIADANQAAVGVVTTVGANTGTAGAGLSLIGDTSTVNQAAALMNDLVALQEDISAVQVLVNQLRADLVAAGILKGSA